MLKELTRYMEKCLKQGHPIGNIKLKLLGVGYSPIQVQEAVSAIKRKKLHTMLALSCTSIVVLVLMLIVRV